MSDVEATVEVQAAPEEVWRVLVDVARVGEWLTVHDGFDEAPERLQEGSELQQRVSSGDLGAAVEWSVEEIDAPVFMAWRGRATGGAKLRTTYRLTAEGDGTRVDCHTEFELPGGPIGAVAGKVAEPRGRDEAERSLVRLRALVERDCAVEEAGKEQA
jgi:carbon monoxide dehydrogenase subunit G